MFESFSCSGLSHTPAQRRKRLKALPAQRQAFGEGYLGDNTDQTPHPDTSRDPVHWMHPDSLHSDWYKQAPQCSEQNDEAKCL